MKKEEIHCKKIADDTKKWFLLTFILLIKLRRYTHIDDSRNFKQIVGTYYLFGFLPIWRDVVNLNKNVNLKKKK